MGRFLVSAAPCHQRNGLRPRARPRPKPPPPQLEPEHTLQLLPGERCLSAAWQNLTPEPPLEPHRTAAALLTTRRLMLVAGDLSVLAEVPTSPEGGGAGVPHPVTSFVWAGPALLYMTAAGQVRRRAGGGERRRRAAGTQRGAAACPHWPPPYLPPRGSFQRSAPGRKAPRPLIHRPPLPPYRPYSLGLIPRLAHLINSSSPYPPPTPRSCS